MAASRIESGGEPGIAVSGYFAKNSVCAVMLELSKFWHKIAVVYDFSGIFGVTATKLRLCTNKLEIYTKNASLLP